MAKDDALNQLKDIHLPLPVGWWPLAPGWYLLMLFLFCFLVFLCFRGYRYYLNTQAKRQALVLLDSYCLQYNKDKNAPLMSARISELLKRVALVYFPRQQVASIHGQAWINFLNKTSKGIDFELVKSLLLDSPYNASKRCDLNPLIKRAKLWIKQRKAPCLK